MKRTPLAAALIAAAAVAATAFVVAAADMTTNRGTERMGPLGPDQMNSFRLEDSLSYGVQAAAASAPLPPAAQAASAYTGNYCASCHTAEDNRPAAVLAWNGGIERAGVDGCPAATRVREEVYYTERMLLAVDRARSGVGGRNDATDARIETARQGYSRLLDMPVTTLDAFVAEAQSLRFQIGKIYSQLNELDAAARRLRALFLAALVTLALLVALGWGWRNTARFAAGVWTTKTARNDVTLAPARSAGEDANSVPAEASNRGGSVSLTSVFAPSPALRLGASVAYFATIVVQTLRSRQTYTVRGARNLFPLFVVLLLFALPIFRPALPPLAETDAEGQARLAALDLADRAASAADRAAARTWLLARTGAAWNAFDNTQAAAALHAAQVAAAEGQAGADAFWGEAEAVRENAVSFTEDLAKAKLAAADLESARGRAWGLRLAAADWIGVAPPKAASLLEGALDASSRQPGLTRDLDLRALAVTWAGLDPAAGLALARQVQDPALRAWALRDLAARSGDPALYAAAADAARAANDSLARARSLGASARLGARQTPGAEVPAAAAAAAASLPPGPARAFLLADLAGLAPGAAPGVAGAVDPAYPAARALAYARAGQTDAAWAAAAGIADSFERGHAQAALALQAGSTDLARQVADRTLRDRTLRDLAIARRDLGLAQAIVSPYHRVQALADLGDHQAAAEAAESLDDFYPLAGLAVAWAPSDPDAALALVDRMDREADRAAALRAVAAATGDEAVFRRALNLALAARVRGDPAAPVQASLSLGRAVQAKYPAWAGEACAQAFDIAQKMSVKYR